MVYVNLVIVAFIFGGTFVSGRVLAGEVPSFTVVFLRFLIATVILLGVSYLKGDTLPRLSLRMWLCVVGLGLANLMYNVFFITGLQFVPTGRAAIIIAMNPAVTVVVSGILLKECLSRRRIVGIILALTGAVIAISNAEFSMIIQRGMSVGDIMVFCAVLCWVGYALLSKYALKELSVLNIVTLSCIIGLVIQIPFVVNDGSIDRISDYSLSSWLALFYLGAFGTVIGFLMYYHAVDSIGVTRTSVFINLIPICAIFEAWLILGERVTLALIIGGAMVLLGVFFTNSSAKSKLDIKKEQIAK